MEETAAICAAATQQSLVILDEVGRGTSTFDGLALAQAVVEHLYTMVQARCLFATHYHELTLLGDTYPGISSYYAASKKTDNGIVFLYTIIKGIADGSFGIEVAKLAQLPPMIITRAQQILATLNNLEQTHAHAVHQAIATTTVNLPDAAQQLLQQENNVLKEQLMQVHEALKRSKQILSQLQSIEYDDLSPKKAFDILWKLKEL
jgi:DNA mismatch repair protein MutS